MTESTKRKYTRRTEEDRIQELEDRIQEMKGKIEARKRKDSPLVKEHAKMQARLRKFADLAMECGRADVSNSAVAFAAGLGRSLAPDEGQLKSWNTESIEVEDDA
jgi:TolA-binding protein